MSIDNAILQVRIVTAHAHFCKKVGGTWEKGGCLNTLLFFLFNRKYLNGCDDRIQNLVLTYVGTELLASY